MVRLPKLGVQRARQEKERRSKSVSVIVISILVCFSFLVVSLIPVVEASPEGWSEDVRITYNTEAWDDEPVIAANGENVHLIWKNTESGAQEIFYINSNDSGETWSDFKQLSLGNPVKSVRPSLAVSGDNIHVVWDDSGGLAASEVRYTRSTDGGITWSEPMFISLNDGHNSQGPKIAVSEDGLNVHVVWVDSRHGSESSPPNTEIYYNRSTDEGLTWEGEVRLTEALYRSTSQNIAVNGHTVHLVWTDERNNKWDTYYKRSTNNGETWGSDIALADGPNPEGGPDVAVWDENVHVVYVEDVSANEDKIIYRNSSNLGETWSEMRELTSSPIRTEGLRLVAIGEEVHLVWFDGRDGGNEIYYKNYVSEVWGPDTPLTYTDNSESLRPDIAIYNDKIHVTWFDDRDGIREVYYKRSPDFVNVPEFNIVIIPVIVTIIIYISFICDQKKEKQEKNERRTRK